MSNDKLGNFKLLITNPGWKDYQEELRYRFDKENQRWRKALSKDEKLQRLAGYLDGIEFAMEFVEKYINEYQEQIISQQPE